jgi:hypothetical protein
LSRQAIAVLKNITTACMASQIFGTDRLYCTSLKIGITGCWQSTKMLIILLILIDYLVLLVLLVLVVPRVRAYRLVGTDVLLVLLVLIDF